MEEACGQTPPDPSSSFMIHAAQATPKASGCALDNVAGQLYNQHEYCTPIIQAANDGSHAQSIPDGLKTPQSGESQFSTTYTTSRMTTPASARSVRQGFANLRQMTPQGRLPRVYNPFESPLMKQLNHQINFSPNMFVETIPEEGTEPFQWSIDQMALLNPTDIEEKDVEAQFNNLNHNSELDSKAQNAIDEYFSSHQHIAPSPWSESLRRHELPRTPASRSAESPMVFQLKPPSSGKGGDLTLFKDAASQTELSLPKDFDLQAVLCDYYSNFVTTEAKPKSEEDANDCLSSSSLRRKLFFQGMAKNSPILTPVKVNEDHASSPSLLSQVSPVVRKTPNRDYFISSGLETPGSTLFSSSPIRGHEYGDAIHFVTPSLRRCSTAPEIHDSPDFSPIISSDKASSNTPSNIPATPQSYRPIKHFNSPGMSPITGADRSLVSCSKRKSGLALLSDSEDLQHQECLPFTDYKDISIQEMDFDDDYENVDKGCEQLLQDTGYQTNSLQSTNMDAVSSSNLTTFDAGGNQAHTNLTVQFSNMPLCSETDIEEHIPAIPRKVTSLITPSFTVIKKPNTDEFSSLKDYSVVPNNIGPGTGLLPWQYEQKKSVVIKEKITGEDPTAHASSSLPASEMARLALRRAGEDYDKFCVQKLYSHHDSPLKNVGSENMSFDL